MKISIPMMPGGGDEAGLFPDVRVGQGEVFAPVYNPRRCPPLQGVGLGFLLGTSVYGLPHLQRIATWGVAAASTPDGLDVYDGHAVIGAYLSHRPRVSDHVRWLRSCLVAAHMLAADNDNRQHIAALLAETHRGWVMRGPEQVEALIDAALERGKV